MLLVCSSRQVNVNSRMLPYHAKVFVTPVKSFKATFTKIRLAKLRQPLKLSQGNLTEGDSKVQLTT